MPPDVAQIWITSLEAFAAGFLVGTFAIGKIWKKLKRNRRKRCLAMAEVLEHVCPITNRKAKWRDKWRKRWLALAEKFKESIDERD